MTYFTRRRPSGMIISRRACFALPLFAQSPAAPMVVAACKQSNTVAFVEPESMKVAASLDTGEGPHEVCASADGRLAYVAIYGVGGRPGRQLAVYDVAARRETRRIDLTPQQSPHGLWEHGGKIFFTSERTRTVGRFDPASGKVDWMMGTGQYGSHMIVATPDGRKVYTTNVFDNTVSAIEVVPAPGRPPALKQIPVGRQPEGIGITPDGREVWAGHNSDGRISIIDTATDAVKQTIEASKMAFRIAFTPDGKTAIVAGATGNELVLIDAATKQIAHRIPTPGSVPQGILISPRGKTLFVATGPALLKIDLATQKIVGSCEPGQGVDGLAWGGAPA